MAIEGKLGLGLGSGLFLLRIKRCVCSDLSDWLCGSV